MSAGLHPLYDDGICPLFFHALGKLHARHDRDDLHAGRVEFLKIRHRVTCTKRHERRFLLADDIYDLILIRGHEHDIHTERTICQRTAATDLLACELRRTAACRDDAGTASIRNCRGEIRLRDPCHASLQNRRLDTEQFFQLISHTYYLQ